MTKKLISLITLGAFAATAYADHHGEQTAIKIEFPPPFLIGTPVQVNLSHLEDAGTPAPVIMAPKNVANLANGKEVTSSDDFPIIGGKLGIEGDAQAALEIVEDFLEMIGRRQNPIPSA